MTLFIQEVNDRDELPRYKCEWDALCKRSQNADLFHSYDWIMAWLTAFWRENDVAFVFVRDGEQLLGCVPLLSDRNGELWCAESLVTPVNRHSIRTNMIVANDWGTISTAVFEYLCETRRDLRVGFKNVRADSPLKRELERKGMFFATINQPASPYIDLTCGKEAYWQARSSHFRHELRRKRRRMNRVGQVEFRKISSPDGLRQGLEDVMTIERNSWKEQSGTAFTSSPQIASFYRGVADRTAATGTLGLYLAYLDGAPIAHVYGVSYKNTYYAIKTSYHQEYRQLSPGAVLFAHVLDDAIDSRFASLDLLGETSRWKKDLATGQREQVDLCVFEKSWCRCRVCRHFQREWKPFLKRNLPYLIRVKQLWADARLKSHR